MYKIWLDFHSTEIYSITLSAGKRTLLTVCIHILHHSCALLPVGGVHTNNISFIHYITFDGTTCSHHACLHVCLSFIADVWKQPVLMHPVVLPKIAHLMVTFAAHIGTCSFLISMINLKNGACMHNGTCSLDIILKGEGATQKTESEASAQGISIIWRKGNSFKRKNGISAGSKFVEAPRQLKPAPLQVSGGFLWSCFSGISLITVVCIPATRWKWPSLLYITRS